MSNDLPQTIDIDISKATLDCHAHPAGIDRQFANTATGHKAVIAWVRQWAVERTAYEATGTYHRALEVALTDLPCVKFNPERARRFAQATGTLAKTDRIDARLLARMAVALLKRQCAQRLNQIARHITALDAEIATVIAADEKLARRHDILTSIAGLGTLTANQMIATMPELGSLDNKQAASLAGLAPVARQSGQ